MYFQNRRENSLCCSVRCSRCTRTRIDPGKICDTKFKPAKFEDNTEKVKIGKTYQNRKVKILQFSEQIKQTNSRNDFNPVELRIAYMKKHHSDYKNQENPGYNRS